jgi:hypothetical protein
MSVAQGQVTITNFVRIGNNRYATLDNVAITSTATGCQNVLATLPTGWVLAPVSNESIAAVFSYTWGTTCLVLATGASYRTRSGAACGTGQLVRSGTRYRVSQCSRRILISRAATGTLLVS